MKRKLVIIGDVHGRQDWKRIANIEGEARYIFLGDYFDSFDISIEDQVKNFEEILEFKKNNDVILLMGNHDFHYIHNLETYSGWSGITRMHAEPLLKSAGLKVLHEEHNILFSHAGVTQSFLDGLEVDHMEYDWEKLNDYLLENPTEIRWKYKRVQSHYGDNIYQGPLWVRPYSLLLDMYEMYQVVGHTQVEHIANDNLVWFCDCPGDYLVYDGQFKPKSLPAIKDSED